MSFSLRLYRKMLGILTHNTVDNLAGQPAAATSVTPKAPFTDKVTLAAPETTDATILDVTGKGYLLHFSIEKPTTTNSVAVEVTITLDGVAIATAVQPVGGNTGVRIFCLVGQVQLPDPSQGTFGPPVFLPFNRSLKIEAKYDATPGGSENIVAKFHAVYA